jgi:UDP-glucose-4-epimerase GalE
VRVLVTGGAGYVGSFTSRALLRAGHEVVVLDIRSRGRRDSLPGDTPLVVDGIDSAAVGTVLEEHGIEAVLHFAAFLEVGESVTNPRLYYRNNVAATLTLLETMMEHDVRRLVFSSTCAVYGEAEGETLSEDLPTRPASPYAFTKLAIETMIRDFSRAYGLGHVLLRYFNAAGGAETGEHGEDHRPETHLIPLVLQNVAGRRDRLHVYGDDYPTPDGTCVRDYVHVEDLATAHELALRACPNPSGPDQGRVYNVGTGSGQSVLDVIRSAGRVTGERVRYDVAGRRPGDPPRLVASAGRLRDELGWKPLRTEVDDIVASAWAWHRSHPEGYAR